MSTITTFQKRIDPITGEIIRGEDGLEIMDIVSIVEIPDIEQAPDPIASLQEENALLKEQLETLLNQISGSI